MNWVNKDTEIYCSFAKDAGNTGCQMMNTAFYYYGLNKIYKSFSVNSLINGVISVKTLGIKGFAITMPYKIEVLKYVDEMTDEVKDIGAANTVINNNGILKAYNTDYLAAKEVLIDCVGKHLYILGDGGYSKAVQSAARSLNINHTIVRRDSWSLIDTIRDSYVYNCTPVEDIKVDESNTFIDCITTTKTGKYLSWLQASHQFKLYTKKELPIRRLDEVS